jgi:uncharacterized protein
MTEPLPRERFPTQDDEVASFARALGLPGIVDIHVHLLPHRLQEAVWAYFDRLDDPAWPIIYRDDEAARFARLRDLGVVSHTALAYAHKPGVAEWCNHHTLAAADAHPQVLPTFTFHPEDEVERYVDDAITRGGRIAKVHLQVGRFHATDPRLTPIWSRLETERIPAVVHASAVYGVDGGHEYCGPDAVRALLDRHPDLLVIVAHLGLPDGEGFVRLAEQVPTLRLDTTMALTDPPYFEPVPVALLPRLAALHDRILFGSDFPTIPHNYVAAVRGLAQLGLDAAGLRRVLHDNAVELVDLAGT